MIISKGVERAFANTETESQTLVRATLFSFVFSNFSKTSNQSLQYSTLTDLSLSALIQVREVSNKQFYARRLFT
jgi:hypothetical protein